MATNGQDPIDTALAAVEKSKLAAQAVKVNEALDALDSHVLMLKGMGVEVSVSLTAPVDRPWDKIEQPGSVKAPGWYAYVNFLDEEDTKRRIDAAKRAAAYAANGGA